MTKSRREKLYLPMVNEGANSLDITLFGSPVVRLAGQIVTGFRSSKAQALLYYLAVTGRPHTRLALAGLLWGDQPEAAARVSLNKCLSNLNELVGGALQIDRQSAAFNLAYPHQLDSTQVGIVATLPATAASIPSLQSALALYRGDFLEGFYVREAADFEAWQLLQRAYYRQIVVNGLYTLATCLDQVGDVAGAILQTRRLIYLEPWREEAHRYLMRLLAANGQRAAALAQFEECRRLLWAELGVEPDEQTLTTFTAIRRGDYEERIRSVPTVSVEPASVRPARQDWGEAPDISGFFGRQAEVEKLCGWLVEERCRLITLLGMGGIGKSALATKVAKVVEKDFDALVWRSLRNAPPLAELLGQCIQALAKGEWHEMPPDVGGRLAQLLQLLRQERCLLIFDNYETLFRGGRVGQYLAGYEGYGEMLKQIAQVPHQSCLLLTSREKPREIAPLAGADAPTRIHSLPRLSPADTYLLLQGRGLVGSSPEWAALNEGYSGNPLALQIASDSIRELFDGKIGNFLRQETILFGGISELLAQQVARLSSLEQEVILWLAVEREGVESETLAANLIQPASKIAILEALQALRQRSLVERVEEGFALQNVVLEYLTARLIAQCCEEISGSMTSFLHLFPLIKADAKSYLRESQRKLILTPIADHLEENYGRRGAIARLQNHLAQLRVTHLQQASYAAGNLLNLLIHFDAHRGLDFSHLAVWHADLRGIEAHELNFSGADLVKSAFSDNFAAALAVVFSPDGEHLAAGTEGQEVRIWRVQDRQLVFSGRGHSGPIFALCYSPDGALLASASGDHSIRIWDAQSGHTLAILKGHTGGISSLAFSADGSTLASGSRDSTIRLWDAATWQPQAILQGHTGTVRTLCFTPDGSTLASGSNDHLIQLWRVADGELLATLEGHDDIVFSLSINGAGTLLASTSEDRTVRLWELATRRCQSIWRHPCSTYIVSFSPDGEMIAEGCWDHNVRLFEVQSGRLLGVLQGHTDGVSSISFSPNGSLLASSSWDQRVCLWNVANLQCIATLRGYHNGMLGLNFIPAPEEGRYLLVGGTFTGTICLWDGENGRFVQQWQATTASLQTVAVSPVLVDGKQLFASGGDAIRLWRYPNGELFASLPGYSREVLTLSFSPDGRVMVSSGASNVITVWDCATWQPLTTLHGHSNSLRSLAFSPDGRLLASGGDDLTICLWDTATWQIVRRWDAHRHWIIQVCFSPDGRTLASGAWDQSVRLWEVESGEEVALLQHDVVPIGTLAFSPDGALLACNGINNTIVLWDLQRRVVRATLVGHQGLVCTMTFRPDGRVLASGSNDESVRLWEVESGECIHIMHTRYPYDGMKIGGATGLTPAQRAALVALGATKE